jgi:TetR/AcrR family transcriptional repressor of nem operon
LARSSWMAVAEKRREVLDVAARLFRERGVAGVSMAEVMAVAGLLHGGFHGHFESKDALAAEACASTFGRGSARRTSLSESPSNDGLSARLDFYLGAAHRDVPGSACAAPTFMAEAARDGTGVRLRQAYVAGIHGLVGALERLLPASLRRRRRERALLTLAAMVGAVSIPRATGGDLLSDEILEAVRRELGGALPCKDAADQNAPTGRR